MLDLGSEDNDVIEEQLYGAACYVARITMESMGTLFRGARDIMVSLHILREANGLIGFVRRNGLANVLVLLQKRANQCHGSHR